MNCTELEDYLAEHVDERSLDLPADLARHLADCAACQQIWRADRQLTAAIAAWAAEPPPDCRPVRLATIVAARPLTTSTRPRATVPSGWSTALVALIALGLGLAAITPARQSLPSVADGPSPELATNGLSASVAELWAGVQAGPQRAAETVQQMAAAPAIKRLPAWPLGWTATDEAEPSALSAMTALSPVDPSWPDVSRPLRTQVGEAFKFLRVAWPNPETSPNG